VENRRLPLVRRGYGCSDVGRRREVNEDAFVVDDVLGLYVVADGMGGHSAGEVASHQAIETLHNMVMREREALTELEQVPCTPEPPGGSRRPFQMRRAQRILESAVQHATYMIFGMAEYDPARRGMGTTLSALFLCGDYALTAQVGDSRVYRVRSGLATQITEDHTLVAWQLKQGLITREEARSSSQKNVITRAVGSRDYVHVDTNCVAVEAGDIFLLCSDGVHGYFEADEIGTIMQLGPQAATRRLTELANARGGRDNITSVAVELIGLE
jgi:serine/threonine protein phosphatase PrpC